MREQEPDNPLIYPIGVEGGFVAVDTQIIDFPVRHTIDGKEVTCSFYPSVIIMN